MSNAIGRLPDGSGSTHDDSTVSGRVSVCIPTYRRPALLCELLDSVLGQTYRDIEVIITDNSPDDDTSTMIAARFGDTRVKYLKNERNLGMDGNTLRALSLVTGEYFTFTPDDDLWIDSKKLDKQVNFFRANPDINCCFSNAQHIRENGSPALPFPSIYDRDDCVVIESTSLRPSQSPERFVCILTGIIRSTYLEEFRRSWSYGSEEHFLWFLGGTGERIGFCHESLVAIRESGHNWEVAAGTGDLVNYRTDSLRRAQQLSDIYADLSGRYGRRLVHFDLRTEAFLYQILVRLIGWRAAQFSARFGKLKEATFLRAYIQIVELFRRTAIHLSRRLRRRQNAL